MVTHGQRKTSGAPSTLYGPPGTTLPSLPCRLLLSFRSQLKNASWNSDAMHDHDYLILITGVIGSQKWHLGGSVNDLDDGPLYFLAKHFPNVRIKVFSATDEKRHHPVSNCRIRFPNLNQRAMNVLRWIEQDRKLQAQNDLYGSSSPTLIFAGHDIGGILVKQVLVKACSEAQFDWVAKGTAAALFFETPHVASNLYAWEKNILRLLALSEARLDLVSFFQYLPLFSSQLEEEFQSLLGSFYTVNFYAKSSPLHSISSQEHQSQTTRYDHTELLNCEAGEIWSIRESDLEAEIICRIISAQFRGSLKSGRHLSRSFALVDPKWHLVRSSIWPILSSFNDWVFETQWYLNWIKNKENSVIHIIGPSGSGITALTSKIFHRLRSTENTVLAYSMLSVSERAQDNGESSGKSLFHSLCQQMIQILFGSQASLPLYAWLVKERIFTKEALKGLLCSLLSSYTGKYLFCIIHGVHTLSIDMQKQFFKDFEMIVASSQAILKLLITSDVHHLWQKLPEPNTVVHLREEQDKNKVMRLLITTRIEDLAGLRPVWRQPKQKEYLINKLCSESNTIFEVSQKLDLIESTNTPETTFDVQLMMANIPSSLEQTIDAIFRSRAQLQSFASAALAWVIFSSRPLSLSELSVCIAVGTSSETTLDLEGIKSKISWNPGRDVQLALGPLIHISGDKVQILHRSCTDVLRSRPYLQISEDPHLFLLLECLRYLELISECWKESVNVNVIENELNREVSLVEYAAVHWSDHYFLAHDKSKAATTVFDFLLHPECFNPWFSMLSYYYRSTSPRDTESRLPESPVEVACYFGLLEVVDKFLEQTPFPDYLTEQFAIGLDFASEKGHVVIVEHILTKGIRSSNALRKAAQFGQIKTVQALVNSSIFDIEERDDSGYNPLLEASWGGHLEVVAFLLGRRANVDVQNGNGLTPLHLACRIGQEEVAAELISFNTPITPQDTAGYTALMYAAEAGFNQVLHTLISALRERNPGIEPLWSPVVELNRCTTDGNTALHLAVSGGHQRTVKLLLELEADPRRVNNIGYTPLHLAAKAGFLGIVQILIQSSSKGGDDDMATELKVSVVAESPLELAVTNQHYDVIKELLRSHQQGYQEACFQAVSYAFATRSPDSYLVILELLQFHHDSESQVSGPLRNEHGSTALHMAIEFGNLNVVNDILEREFVPVDFTDGEGRTPLHIAAKYGNVEIIDVLLKYEAGLINTTIDGKTALHIAAECGHKEACMTLRHKSESLAWIKSEDGSLPIILAAKRNHLDLVEELLKLDPGTAKEGLLHSTIQNGSEKLLDLVLAEKPNLDWTDKNGNAAVHLAVSGGKVSMVEVLHKAGASMCLPNKSCGTPLFCAIEAINLDMVKALLNLPDANLKPQEKNTAGLTPLLKACSYFFSNPQEITGIVDALLKKFPDMDVNVTHPDSGKTPLHYSVDTETEDMTLLLLKIKTTNPNIRNNRGSTPIFLATEMGKFKSVQALLDKGANPSIQNYSKTTPLHRAAGGDHHECIRLLATPNDKYKVDINVKSNWGYTPLGLAASNGYIRSVKALLEHNPASLTITNGDNELNPLALAADNGFENVVDELFKHMLTSDIDQTIHDAVVGGHKDVVSMLLSKTNDANIVDEKYGSLLGLAVAKEQLAIVQILLAVPDIRVNTTDLVGRTPLMMGVLLENLDIVQALTKANADLNIQSQDIGWPLVRAIIQQSPDIVKHLVSFRKINLRQVDSRGHGALYWASRQGNDEIFRFINDAVSKLSDYRSICDLAIHAAVASNNDKALDSLLEVQDIDLNVADCDGWTSLYTAQCYEFDSLRDKILRSGGKAETELTLKTPVAWDAADKAGGLSVDRTFTNIVKVEKTFWSLSDSEIRCSAVRANHPMRGNSDWYFEVKIEQEFKEGKQIFGVGVCEDNFNMFRLLGFDDDGISFGYHADDGNTFPEHSSKEMDDGETYGEDDVIGCGYDHAKKSVFFTRNGLYLGRAFSDVKGKLYPAVFMSTEEVGVCISANFTNTPKWLFDLHAPRTRVQKQISDEQSEATTSPVESTKMFSDSSDNNDSDDD